MAEANGTYFKPEHTVFGKKWISYVTRLNDVLTDSVLESGVVIVFIGAMLCTLHWHVLGLSYKTKGCRSDFVRSVGIALIILQIFYCEHLPTSVRHQNANNFLVGQPWISSCIYIFIEQVVGYALFFYLRWFCCKSNENQNSDENTNVTPFKAWNVYMDFTVTIRRGMLTFLMQLFCILVYVWVMNGMSTLGTARDMRTINLKTGLPMKFDACKWLLAVMIGTVMNESDTGRKFNAKFWTAVWMKYDSKYDLGLEKRSIGHMLSKIFETPLGKRLVFRMFLDFTINSGCYAMVMATAPILLSVATPLDFLRDIIAFTFILRLDDLFESKDLAKAATYIDNKNQLMGSEYKGLLCNDTENNVDQGNEKPGDHLLSSVGSDQF